MNEALYLLSPLFQQSDYPSQKFASSNSVVAHYLSFHIWRSFSWLSLFWKSDAWSCKIERASRLQSISRIQADYLNVQLHFGIWIELDDFRWFQHWCWDLQSHDEVEALAWNYCYLSCPFHRLEWSLWRITGHLLCHISGQCRLMQHLKI